MSLSEAKPNSAVDELLDAVGRLSTTDLERFSDEVMRIRARRRAPSLPAREAELLRQINAIALPGDPAAYAELIRKRQAETITAQELEELVRITDAREEANARRVGLLAELAALRGVALRDVMEELGLRRPADA